MNVLAIANAHALAHVSRVVEIGKVLCARGHAVTVAGRGKYLDAAHWAGFPTRELPYISAERIVEAVRSQKLWLLYQKHELEEFIAAELALYEELKPDLILLDNRPSARTSADMAGIPTAAVLNVHMSNYRLTPFMSYRQAGRGLPLTATLDRAENAIERKVYDRLVMGALNALRRESRLQRLYAYEHEGGDLSLLADLPEFNPARGLPEQARYIGPLTWRSTLPPPSCLEKLDPAKPTVYVTLGSEALPDIAPALASLTSIAQFVVAAGVAQPTTVSMPGVYVESFVNVDTLLPRCAAVCSHGGNGTLYQALRHGLPCIVIATHAEQHYGGKRIQELGFGLASTLKRLQREGAGMLATMLETVLTTPAFRSRTAEFSRLLRDDQAALRAADAIEAWLAARSGRRQAALA